MLDHRVHGGAQRNRSNRWGLLYLLRSRETRHRHSNAVVCSITLGRLLTVPGAEGKSFYHGGHRGTRRKAKWECGFMDKTGITIREAGLADLETILHHRRSMFRDMGEGSVAELDRMVEVARPWLARALGDGSYCHWLAVDSSGADTSGAVAGGGGVLLSPWPANPFDPCTERAIILNVYTEAGFRRRGIARQVMRVILAWVEARGLRSVNLHASDEGRVLYEKLGFVQTNEMRLRFGADE
jgi:GNAT superfamily N-acetyltransferase